MQVTNSCKKRPERLGASKMVVIHENTIDSDCEDELDIEGSIHDSFIQMINKDNNHD